MREKGKVVKPLMWTEKDAKSTKERIINLPVMVRQWFPHTDERHERHDGEVIERVSIHIKVEVRNCRKQEENEIFMQQEKISTNFYISAKYKTNEGEREHKTRRKRGRRETQIQHDQIDYLSSHSCLLSKLNKRRRETNNDQVDSNIPTHLKIVA